MPTIDIHILVNTGFNVVDVLNPQTGEVEGRRLELLDKQTGEQWHYSVNLEMAQLLGQQLMGIGGVKVANGHDMQEVIQKLGDKSGHKN